MATVTVCKAEDLKNGEGRTFQFKRDGVQFEGFVIRAGGELFAYENRCRHLPLPLDYGDDRFFTPDAKHLVCSSHGALYEPHTGKCIHGPCAGASLKPLRIVGFATNIKVEVDDPDVAQ